ncbi:MAG: NapC/NirT family cytochrome c [Bryobacteraceae bacterium]
MTLIEAIWERLRHWFEPVVYLSNNVLSMLGVLMVTAAVVLWIFLLPTLMHGETGNPYTGILTFLLLPAAFFCGLVIIPAGIWIRFRRERRRGSYPHDFPPLDFKNIKLRRLVLFVCAATLANIVIASQLSYSAVSYMDSVTFCGQTCHTVMEPEFAAYQNSPHSRVECVKCHIGPGANWFVKSKLSGLGQVVAVTFNTYDRPIPTPVENLRPARETCEACHWPQKFGADRLEVINKFADDETNTLTKTVLLMHIGGGRTSRLGIHGVHLGPGVVIRYAHSDHKRQTIPWVEYDDGKGKKTAYTSADFKPESLSGMPVRVMDCMDCHNRPTHAYELPERAVDAAMAAGTISPSLPFVKKQAVELLRKSYPSKEEALRQIPAALGEYYRSSHPSVFAARQGDIARAAGVMAAIYGRNVFPTMRVAGGAYPNNIGHTDFPGCYRCHDDAHASAAGAKISQDCNACHSLLAMEEPAPKILSDLGLAAAAAPAAK